MVKPEFQLKIETEFNKDKIGAELHLKKSDTNDMYFFNRYDATLEKANKEQLSQTIYLNKGQGITMKETYNLLNGRAVNTDLINKAGEKYNAWIQLDLERRMSKAIMRQSSFIRIMGMILSSRFRNILLRNYWKKKREGTFDCIIAKG